MGWGFVLGLVLGLRFLTSPTYPELAVLGWGSCRGEMIKNGLASLGILKGVPSDMVSRPSIMFSFKKLN